MYRAGKGNFLILPPQNQTGGTTSKPLQPLHLFERMTDFQALHPKNKRFLTDFTRILQNLGEKNSFSENLTV